MSTPDDWDRVRYTLQLEQIAGGEIAPEKLAEIAELIVEAAAQVAEEEAARQDAEPPAPPVGEAQRDLKTENAILEKVAEALARSRQDTADEIAEIEKLRELNLEDHHRAKIELYKKKRQSVFVAFDEFWDGLNNEVDQTKNTSSSLLKRHITPSAASSASSRSNPSAF